MTFFELKIKNIKSKIKKKNFAQRLVEKRLDYFFRPMPTCPERSRRDALYLIRSLNQGCQLV